MKSKQLLHRVVLFCGWLAAGGMVRAQGTAFTYQGQLQSSGSPVSGTYDLTFTLYNTNNGGSPVAAMVTNTGVSVSGGLFTVTNDFGAGSFTGAPLWLQIGVGTNSAGPFSPLLPRQQLTPAPYAIMANSASNLLGSLPAAQLSGTLSNSVLPANPNFSGTVTAALFSGSGAGLTSLNASNLASGTVALARLPSAVVTNLETGVTLNGSFSGTFSGNGSSLTSLNASALSSGLVPMGVLPAVVTNNQTGVTLGGTFSGNGNGLTNLNASQLSTGVVPTNVLPGFQVVNNYTAVGGGQQNVVTFNADHSVIGGGLSNNIGANDVQSVIAGGSQNNLALNGSYAAIGGGQFNSASGNWATIAGGDKNTNSSNAGTIAGGQNNTASGSLQPTVGGGYGNTASANYATIAGGINNTNTAYAGTIGGGENNIAGGAYQSTVSGGFANIATNSYAMIPGGVSNIAGGKYSFAAGFQAQATNDGAFVWADTQGTPFGSTNTNSFNVRAGGGVVFATGGTGITVDGVSVVTASPGSIQGFEINDGGSSAYQTFQQAVQAVGGDTALTFSNLFPVATNGGTPSLSLSVNGAAFGAVAGFSGKEAMSRPYSYVVEVNNSTALPHPNTEIGLKASLSFARNGRTTTFGGIITDCTLASSDGVNFLYTFKIESPLAYMAFSTDYHIYQQMTVPDVASNVYAGDFPGAALTGPASAYPQHVSLTQYGETDLNFFSRILENEGIFYFFNQGASPPSLTMGDNVSYYLTSPNSPFIYYGNAATNIPAGAEYIRTFQSASHQITRSSTVDAHDYDNPSTLLRETANGSTGTGATYEFGNAVATTSYDTQLAGVRQGRQTVDNVALAGTATAPDVRAGYTFALTDNTGSGLTGNYVVTSVHHAGFVRVTNGVSTFFYGNEFEAIPATVLFRPALKTPKPTALPCTAKVTGNSGEEITTDAHGRVKALFPWDRYGTADQNASEWIPVASPWAGAGSRGIIFTPRAGDEVLVSFMGGDPDQPVVIGSLFNSDAPPPYSLPDNKTVSTIRTLSSKGGGGFNELKFDDKKGSEDFFMQAQYNMEIRVLNNLTMTVEGNTIDNLQGNVTEGITGNMTDSISGNLAENVTNNLSLTAGNEITLNGPVGIDTAANVESSLAVNTNIYLMAHPIYLLGGNGVDHNHGLAYCGGGVTNFAPGIVPDGPVLWGYTGGVLGVKIGGAHAVLSWASNSVTVAGLLTATAAVTGGFNSAIGDIENLDTSTNSSPALRLIAHGNPPYGALSVSTQGAVSATNTNCIASFGNAAIFVSWLDNNGNWFAKGNFSGNTFITLSDRDAKENFQAISPREVLDKVDALPLSRWNYKQDKTTEHIGPMAQDFYAAFHLGIDNKHIATVDEEGVALAAIQGLNEKLEETRRMMTEKDAELKAQQAALTRQAEELNDVKSRLAALENLVSESVARKQ